MREMPGGMQGERVGGDVGSAKHSRETEGEGGSDWLPRGMQGLRGEWSRGKNDGWLRECRGYVGSLFAGFRVCLQSRSGRMHAGLPGGNADAQKKMQCRGMQGDAGAMRGLSLKGAMCYLRSRAGRMRGGCLRGKEGRCPGNREHKGR